MSYSLVVATLKLNLNKISLGINRIGSFFDFLTHFFSVKQEMNTLLLCRRGEMNDWTIKDLLIKAKIKKCLREARQSAKHYNSTIFFFLFVFFTLKVTQSSATHSERRADTFNLCQLYMEGVVCEFMQPCDSEESVSRNGG